MVAPRRLVGQVGRLGEFVRAEFFGAADAEHLENPLLDLAEHVEEPDAEGELEAGEVEKSDPGKTECEDEADRAAEPAESRVEEAELGNNREEVMEAVETEDDEGHGEPEPHEFAPEERRHPGALTPFFDHLLRQLYHRVAEALVDGPLAVEDGAHADEAETEGDDESEPPAEGFDPGPPRDRRPLGQTFVIEPDRLRVLGCHPAWNELVE